MSKVALYACGPAAFLGGRRFLMSEVPCYDYGPTAVLEGRRFLMSEVTLQALHRRACRCRANLEQISQSRPDPGL